MENRGIENSELALYTSFN